MDLSSWLQGKKGDKKMKAEKRIVFILVFVAALALSPIVAYGQQEITNRPPPTPLPSQMKAGVPPVGQALVPEGLFALQLVSDLKIGQAQNEVQAEDMLSTVGIEPKNGWIADYPVTPDIINEIEESVAASVDAKRVMIEKDEALQAMNDLKVKFGLNVKPGPSSPSVQTPPSDAIADDIIYEYRDKKGVVHFTNLYETIPKEYRSQIKTIRGKANSRSSIETSPEEIATQIASDKTETQENNYTANPGPEVINNYYYDEGPPVVTYYPPPDPYYYMYAWVPYPFWCSGFHFRGFFVLHDFHRHVHFHHHKFVVSNHLGKRAHNKVFVVDPVNRSLRWNTTVNRVSSPLVFDTIGVSESTMNNW